MHALFSVLEFLVALALLSLFAQASPPGGSAHTILEDKIAYQETEIARLDKLVKTRHADVHRYEIDVARLTMEAHCLKTAQRGTAELVEAAELADAALEALSAQVEAQTARTTELTAQYNAECTERAVTASMNWTMGWEIGALHHTVKELRWCSQGTSRQGSICEARQAAVIKTLRGHIKTVTRWGAEKEIQIHLMVEGIAGKEREKEEVARIVEEQKEEQAVRQRYEDQVGCCMGMGIRGEEGVALEARGACTDSDSFISMANLFGDNNDHDSNEELADMSICSVIESSVHPSPPYAVEERIPIPKARPAPRVPSPSKILAGRCLVRKMALSFNPPDSPFAFATVCNEFCQVCAEVHEGQIGKAREA